MHSFGCYRVLTNIISVNFLMQLPTINSILVADSQLAMQESLLLLYRLYHAASFGGVTKGFRLIITCDSDNIQRRVGYCGCVFHNCVTRNTQLATNIGHYWLVEHEPDTLCSTKGDWHIWRNTYVALASSHMDVAASWSNIEKSNCKKIHCQHTKCLFDLIEVQLTMSKLIRILNQFQQQSYL